MICSEDDFSVVKSKKTKRLEREAACLAEKAARKAASKAARKAAKLQANHELRINEEEFEEKRMKER